MLYNIIVPILMRLCSTNCQFYLIFECTTIVHADKSIRRSIWFFELLKDELGAKRIEANIALAEGNVSGVS